MNIYKDHMIDPIDMKIRALNPKIKSSISHEMSKQSKKFCVSYFCQKNIKIVVPKLGIYGPCGDVMMTIQVEHT